MKENKYKKTTCKFCEDDIVSRHFARHLKRRHPDERAVKLIFSSKPQSSERRKLLCVLRNEGNLEPALHGHIKPKKLIKGKEAHESEYTICIHCKGYYKRLSLSRHVKKCFAKKNVVECGRPLINSLLYSTCQKKYGELLNKMEVKAHVFSKMQADDITETAMGDLLIVFYGEDLLKKYKSNRNLYHISNKLRECSKFLICMRNLGEYTDMLSTLDSEKFDDAIEATKQMSRYDANSKSFGAASLALHFGTTLKNISDLATKLILRNKLTIDDKEVYLTKIKRFRKIVENQWTTEIGSLALKDLNEKSVIKPKLLPFTEDIIKLKTVVEKVAEESYKTLEVSKTNDAYNKLSETTLILTLLHNRKRVGDIQYMELNTYKKQISLDNYSNSQAEMASSLTENERILTRHYKRITNIGKGSRPVTILIPKTLQKYFSMLCTIRSSTDWFPCENNYFFTYPQSIRWINGCSIIRKYAKISGAKNPELLTSSRLRKHIATVTQILSLKGNEIDQLAKFMGHTTKTHETFYK